MKKLLLLFTMFLFCFSVSNCQGVKDSDQNNNKHTHSAVSIDDTCRYKLFPTDNMWTFIKLDTRTGKLWQVQYTVQEGDRFQTSINSESLVIPSDEVDGRFTVYPTKNMYNFLLLDQINGNVVQFQWSMEEESRGIIGAIE